MAEPEDPSGGPTSLAMGRYEILLEIASGGMATVFIGRQRGVGGFERLVAIKRLHQHLNELPEVTQSLMDEARIAALIRHPNVVSVHDVCDLGGEHLLVMEYVDGTSLATLMRVAAKAGQKLPLGVALRILCEALHGLHAAHEQTNLEGAPLGIVHRDATPHNILIGADGAVRITDFGVAKAAERTVNTATGVTKGKIKYMAPEQARGKELDRRADVFSMGIVASELVTGQRPFGDQNDAQILLAIVSGEIPYPHLVDPSVPRELDAIISRALAPERGGRFRSAKDFAEALEGHARASGQLATQADVAALVDRLAGDRIRESRQVLRRRLAEIGSGTGPVTSPAVSIPRSAASPPPASQRTVGSLQALAAPRAGSQSASLPLLGAVAGVLALGLAAASVLLFVRSRDDEPAGAASAAVRDAAPAISASAAGGAGACPEGMVHVPAGKFFMGSDEPEATEAERPSFQVTLPSFCIDAFEVRVSAYRACSERGECRRATQAATWPGITDEQKRHYEPECNGVREDRLDHPVNCVDFAMAEQFCKFKNARLPTEAEWEYATRGSDGRLYPWGDSPPTEVHLNACSKECVSWGERVGESLLGLTDADDGHPTTAPVGSFQAGRSQWGALDLAGNVWEWVGSWHAPYTKDPKRAPAGPASGDKRVIRGGAWNGGDKSWLRPSFRYAQVPEARHPAIGFRCAKSL